jgi:Short C-terminal domain
MRMTLSPAFTRMRQRRATTFSGGDVVDPLTKLAALLESGALTREEFDKLKGELLSQD